MPFSQSYLCLPAGPAAGPAGGAPMPVPFLYDKGTPGTLGNNYLDVI